MAGPFYVDDGGDGSDGLSWATAYTSINALDAAVTLASGEIVYFGHDSQCQATNSANLTITGPTSDAPVIFISATQGSNPPTYAQATANQIDTTEGAYGVTFDGSFALHGIKINSGSYISCSPDTNEYFSSTNCIFALGANSYLASASCIYSNVTVDLSADGTTNRTGVVLNYFNGNTVFNGLSFVNAAYRTGAVIGQNTPGVTIIGGDFSGFTNATTCEIALGAAGASLYNCKTAATWVAVDSTSRVIQSNIKFVNCSSADATTSLMFYTQTGELVSSSSIYRTGGASFESTANAWLITTQAICTVDSPFYSEYIYGRITTTGSKTFTTYIVNDTADLNNDEVWLEVEYKADASSGKWTLITDKPADRTTAAAAQTDDTTSTWNGTGPSFTYKQSLAVTATVNTTGQYRARVAVGKASIASSSYFYIDPDVRIS